MLKKYMPEAGAVAVATAGFVVDPETAALGGAVIGFTVAYNALGRVLDKAAENREAYVVDWSHISDSEVEAVIPTSDDETRTRRIARKATTPAALMGALAGALLANGALANYSNQPAPAAIEIVVDHSGATIFPFDGAPAVLPKINNITESFKDPNGDIQEEAIVTVGGEIYDQKISEVAANKPYPSGDAPIGAATKNALETTAIVKGQTKNQNTAVVIVTNGNNIGSADSIIAKSKAQGNTPVYVVNVEQSKDTSASNISAYQKVTSETHGHYWSVENTNASKIGSQVEANIKPATKKSKSNPDQLRFIGYGVVAGVAAEEAIRRSKKGALNRNLRRR